MRFEIGVHDGIQGSRSKPSFLTEVGVGIRGRSQGRVSGQVDVWFQDQDHGRVSGPRSVLDFWTVVGIEFP